MSSELVEVIDESNYDTYDFHFPSPGSFGGFDFLNDLNAPSPKRVRRRMIVDSAEGQVECAIETAQPEFATTSVAAGEPDARLQETRGRKRMRRKAKVSVKKEATKPQPSQWIIESAKFPADQVWLEPRPKRKPQPVEVPPQTLLDAMIPRYGESSGAVEPLSYDKDQAEIAAMILQKRRMNEATQWRQRMLNQQKRHRGKPDLDVKALQAKHSKSGRSMEPGTSVETQDVAHGREIEIISTPSPPTLEAKEEAVDVSDEQAFDSQEVPAELAETPHDDCSGPEVVKSNEDRSSTEAGEEALAPGPTATTFAVRNPSSHSDDQTHAATSRAINLSKKRTADAMTVATQEALRFTPRPSIVTPAQITATKPDHDSATHLRDAYCIDDEEILARNLRILYAQTGFSYTSFQSPSSTQPLVPFHPFHPFGTSFSTPQLGSLQGSPEIPSPALPVPELLPTISAGGAGGASLSPPSIDIQHLAPIPGPNPIPIPIPSPALKSNMNMFTGQAREPGVIGGNYAPVNNTPRKNMFSNR